MSTETILGHYRIIREIARSNDIVYEALDTRINRRVAIKELFLPAGVTDSVRQDRIQRFYREARAAGQLTHPNIVTIYETEEENGRYFIVMEYLEGETLRDRLQREGSVPVEEAVQILFDVLDALIEAHSKGVIHRDIKPENIHLLPDGRIKLTDFGIARLKFEPSLTVDGQIFGTPSYMSPEQVMGHEIDERSDLFSAGVVLYEMVAGFKPFTGDSVVSITYNIMNSEPPSPPGVPYAIEWVIRRALQKSPPNRFESALEMKKALQEAMDSLHAPPILATPMGPPVVSGSTGGMPPTAYPTVGNPPGTYYPTGVPSPTGSPYPTVATPGTVTGAPAPGTVQPPVYIPPPPPPKPLLSPAARHFLGTVFAVVLIGFAVLGLLGVGWYAFSKAYERYQLQKQDERLAADMERAKVLYEKGRYLDAYHLYYRLLPQAKSEPVREKIRHNLAVVAVTIGNQQATRGDLRSAAQSYEAALQYKQLPEAHVGLANIYLRQGDWEGAANRLLMAADLSPPHEDEYREKAAEIIMQQADQDYRQGRVAEAWVKWEWVMKEAPGSKAAEEARQKISEILNARFRWR